MTALVQGGTKMVFFESRFLCMKKMGQGHKRTSSRRGVIIAGTVLGILLILVSRCCIEIGGNDTTAERFFSSRG